MPFVLDIISGEAWVRGCLPILSRVGQSVPPLLYAERLRNTRLKKYPLFSTSMAMALPFLGLAAIWWQLDDRRIWWMTPLFLVLYFVFFCATGLNQLAYGTLQGKLVRPNLRGLLLGLSGVFGSVFAVTSALLWLKPWILMPNFDGFTFIFLFNGTAFLLAGMVSLYCEETVEPPRSVVKRSLLTPFATAWLIVKEDPAFRKATYVALLFISSLLLFPHYQSLGRDQVGSQIDDLIYWVIAQNISVGIYSPVLGRVADQFGNRLAIRIGLFAAALTPLLALAFAHRLIPHPADWFWLTFVLLGLTPVVMNTIFNYTLELVEEDQHPQYLSTMRIVFAVPFVLGPLVGYLIGKFSYTVPFVCGSVLVFWGGLLTFRMVEPRLEADNTTAQPPSNES